jgi:hypothetical protein
LKGVVRATESPAKASPLVGIAVDRWFGFGWSNYRPS